MKKPNIIPLGAHARIDCSNIDAVRFLAHRYGALDAYNAKLRWVQEYPGVPVPLSLPSLFSPAVAAGKMVKVARGIYAAA